MHSCCESPGGEMGGGGLIIREEQWETQPRAQSSGPQSVKL